MAVLDDRAAAPAAAACRCCKEIQGRSTDFVVAADGTVMHGLALIYILRDLPGVQAFKIVQDSLQRTKVQLVAGPSASTARARSRASWRASGAGWAQRCRVDVGVVTEIPAEKSGKFRYVVSHVAVGQAPEAVVRDHA